MVNKPLIRPYVLGGVALGGAARIPLIRGGCSRGDWGTLRIPREDWGSP